MARLASQSFIVPLEPEVLVWARTSLSLSPDAVAATAGVSTQELLDWEAGTARPRMTQLRRLSKSLHCTVAALLLPEPPPRPRKPRDYRTLPTRQQHPLGPTTLLALRRAYRVVDLANALEEQLGHEAQPIIPRLSGQMDPEAAAGLIREMLGVTVDDQARAPRKHNAYHRWRLSVESLGVLVLEAPMARSECRGFSIYDPASPIITVTNEDFPAPRVFSLLHELAHLSLHASGLCEVEAPEGAPLPHVEVFCNHVAGAVMVPEAALLEHKLVAKHESREWDDSTLEGIGASFKASKDVVLRRLLLFGRTTETFYQDKRAQWETDHANAPDFAPIVTWSRRAFNRNGVAFTGLVLEAERARVISSHEAADYLETKPKYLPSLEAHLINRMSMR